MRVRGEHADVLDLEPVDSLARAREMARAVQMIFPEMEVRIFSIDRSKTVVPIKGMNG